MKQVLGNRIFIENPFFGKKDSVIHVEASIKEEVLMEQLKKVKKLPVFKAGDQCRIVKEGDEVFIDTDNYMNASRVILEIGGVEKGFFILRETDVAFIY